MMILRILFLALILKDVTSPNLNKFLPLDDAAIISINIMIRMPCVGDSL